MNILEVKGLSKSFGQHKVIENLSFAIPEHTIYGFLGENGAGKTTTMKMALGLLQADAGEIRICGEAVIYGSSKTNQNVGYLPDVPEYYSYMTPMEYLRLCGQVAGMKKEDIKNRSAYLLELVGLKGVRRKIGGFSRGMKQRLGIAQAMLHAPKLLICDEPTSALDPVGRKEILDILLQVKEEMTVVFSTHILSDVERICDHVAVLHKGGIVLEGSLEKLKSSGRKQKIVLELGSAEEATKAKEELAALNYVEAVHPEGTLLTMDVKDVALGGSEILHFLGESKYRVLRYEVGEASLESLFLEVVK